MFKFRDDSYIEGQLDLCNIVNDKYPALTEFFDSEKGYDIVDYNRHSTTSIEKVVYEAGDPSDTHTNKRVVANYWRLRGCKGKKAKLHKFHYTNDTGKTGQVYITVYDHFQNLDYYDWYREYNGYYNVDFWSDIDARITAYRNYGATTRVEWRTQEITERVPVTKEQKHYVYYFDNDDGIKVNISSGSGKEYGESSSSDGGKGSPENSNEYDGHTLYSDSKGKYYWETVYTTKTVTRTITYPVILTCGDDYFTRDCPDNRVYTFFFCTLNPGDILDVWLEGEDSDAIPDPASYLKVEITFDGSYVEVSPEVQEKTDSNKIEADGFANDMNFDWGRQEVVSGLVNDMQFGWGADLTDDGTATDMQWGQI